MLCFNHSDRADSFRISNILFRGIWVFFTGLCSSPTGEGTDDQLLDDRDLLALVHLDL